MPSVAHAYHGVLTGGLSNQLMHLAEALERACSADAYLVLPRFNAGWFNHVDEATGHAFTDLFDLPRAASVLRPCRLVSGDLGAPPGMRVVARRIADLHPINASWPHWEWFGRLVAALRPAPPVRKGVASLERWVRARFVLGFLTPSFGYSSLKCSTLGCSRSGCSSFVFCALELLC